VHLVLLGDATTHEVHVAWPVPFHLERAGLERPLLADEDVEVVVGGVEARVALGAEGRAKDDEVLGDARVDDVHRAHRAARVVEDPFGAVRVDREARAWVGRGEIGDDVGDHARRVVGRHGESGQLELVEMDGIKEVPSILDRVKPAERGEGDEENEGTSSPLGKWVWFLFFGRGRLARGILLSRS